MIYAIRVKRDGKHRTMVEFPSIVDYNRATYDETFIYSPLRARDAHQWVLDGNEHETGLFVQNGKVEYAEADG